VEVEMFMSGEVMASKISSGERDWVWGAMGDGRKRRVRGA